MKTAIETISPDKARKYLDGNYGNRVVRQAWVENLAGMMQRGEWRATHQGIAFTKDGRLLDGQHRLLAIMRSGKNIDMMVTRDMDEASFRHIDGGRTRSNADRIKLVEDERENAVAVSLVRSYLVAAVVKNNSAVTVDLIENNFLSMSDAFAWVASSFRSSVKNVTRAAVGAACSVYIHKHPTPGKRFVEGLVSGKDLTEKSPTLALRESLIAGRVGINTHDAYWKTIAATKAHKDGRPMSATHAAVEDWMGNKYTRLVHERARKNAAISATEIRTKAASRSK